MTQKRKQRGEPGARELATTIGSDLRTLATHINDLGHVLGSRKRFRIIFRVALAVLCTGLLIFVRQHYDNQPIVGDQPHYMLMEYSLVHDHDFNLANNFAHHDSDTFGNYPPDGLIPGGQVGPGQVHTPSHQYSIHGVGLPLLVLPGYVWRGAAGIEVEMILVAVAVVFLVYYWSKIITKSVKLSFIASAALFASYVFYGLAAYIFPDMLIGALIIASLIIVLARPHSIGWQIVLAVLMGFSVFVHYKLLGFVGLTFLILCYKTWTQQRKLPYATAIPLFILTVAFFYLTHKWFGIWNPSKVIADLGVGMHPEATFKNLSAILFDSARGFVSNNPFFLLLFVGLPIWFRKSRETFVITLVCIAPQVVTFVMFNDWRGGDSPAGRYIMNFLPVLMPTVVFAMLYLRKTWQRLIVAVLFAANAAIAFYYMKIQLGWLGVDSPVSSPILKGTSLAFDHLFPQFDAATNPLGRYDWIRVVVYYLVLIGLMLYGYVLSGGSLRLAKSKNR